jgi:hypothetical protein
MPLVKSPVVGARSLWGEIKAHPVIVFLFALVFAAFLFPWIARQLGALKAKGGALAAVIPGAFTRSA